MSEAEIKPPVAAGNEEAVRAWDTVLYERWKRNRSIYVTSLQQVSDELFEQAPPPAGGRCIDFGCGLGDSTQRMAELVGEEGFALGTDSSPHFIADARREAAEAGIRNIEFEVIDTQVAEWDPIYDYAFSRMGTQFFIAPVPAMRAIRSALKPGGELNKICWRRKDESPIFIETERIAERFLSRPEEHDFDTCGPGPFSLGNPDTCRGILEAAGFEDIELTARDFDYHLGRDLDEAIDGLLAIGPAAELVRINGDHGESKRPEIAAALAEHMSDWQQDDGTVVGRGSVWMVSARNPG